MPYSKDYLDKLGNTNTSTVKERNVVISELFHKLSQGCEKLSIVEKDWICLYIQIVANENDKFFDPYDFPCCKESIFYDRYLNYFNNLDGLLPVKNWNRIVTGTEKNRDIQMLESHHLQWKKTIEITDHSDNLLQNVSVETRHHIKEIKKFCKNEFLGSNKERALIKSMILQSKFFFRNVQVYYEENNQREFYQIDGKKVVIDSFGFIHILFRHYGQLIKEHQFQKSYHIEGLDYKNLPKEMIAIITAYSKISSGQFDGKKIYLKIKEKIYCICFREIKTNVKDRGTISEFRLQTFYPLEDTKKLLKITKNFSNEIESGDFVFYFK